MHGPLPQQCSVTEGPFTRGEEESSSIVSVVSTSSARATTTSAHPLRTKVLRTPVAPVAICRLAAQHLWRQVLGWHVNSWTLGLLRIIGMHSSTSLAQESTPGSQEKTHKANPPTQGNL